MATNLDLDKRLIQRALRLGGLKTKKAVVQAALEEYIQRREQIRIIELFGTVDLDPKYDYKARRRRK